MWRMALRPRWIASLLFALGVAALFGFLAQWQIGQAATNAIVAERPTETVLSLTEELSTRVATSQTATGQRFEITGQFQANDTVIVPNRVRNAGDSTAGWWVVAHFVTDVETDIPVVIGWASSEDQARAAAATFDREIAAGQTPSTVTGRFLPSDAPGVPDGDPQTVTAVSVGHLINIWQNVAPGGAYFGYLISEQAEAGLDQVSTPAPQQQAELNLLNVFYAVEWILFAGFAVYFWWRLVRDAFERERDTADAANA